MQSSKWDDRFLSLANLVSSWSKDPSTKVGAVIVNDNNQVLSTGYNGFPRGLDDSMEKYSDRPYKYAHVIHAEHNAILHCGHSMKDATIYVTHQPCPHCAGIISSVGIKNVIFKKSDIANKWGDSFDVFRQTNINVKEIL